MAGSCVCVCVFHTGHWHSATQRAECPSSTVKSPLSAAGSERVLILVLRGVGGGCQVILPFEALSAAAKTQD